DGDSFNRGLYRRVWQLRIPSRSKSGSRGYREELFGRRDGDKFGTDSDARLRCDEVFGGATAGDGPGDGAGRDCAAATESTGGDRCSHERRVTLATLFVIPSAVEGSRGSYL